MSYLTLSGFAVDVSTSGSTYERSALGEESRSFGGQLVPERRSVSRQFVLETPLSDRDSNRALAGLVQGDGHKWNFDSDLYSSKGLGPQAGYTITMSATGGVIGGYVQVTSGATLTYRKLQNADYSMMVWKYVGAAYIQYVLVFDASAGTTTQYKAGNPHTPAGSDNILNWFSYTTSTGDFTLNGKDIAGTNANSRYDELVIVPYAFTAAMVSAFHTEVQTAGIPFSELPLLNVAGSIIPDGPVQFTGAMASGRFEPAIIGSDLTGSTVSITLSEFQGRAT
tara:strand:- start:126 stop:968 length:843 start_codon:yes stop_codon:yes gene_type:complete